MKVKAQIFALAATLLVLPAGAQVGSRTSGPPVGARPGMSTSMPAVAPDNISPVLTQIQSAARSTTSDLNQLNIRKWKVGNDVKNDAETKAGSIHRNLTAALPEMLSRVQAAPSDFAATFKLYRNLSVLYDVMSSLAESAGAFGSKPEFEGLAADVNRIDQARRALGDRLEALATAKDAEIVRLQNQVKAERAAATATPKKVVVDEDDSNKSTKPAKKVPPKKKPATSPPPPQSNQQ